MAYRDANYLIMTAKSGNTYRVRASSPEHIRVSTDYDGKGNPATFNRVGYTLHGDFSINKPTSNPWEPFYLYMDRSKWTGKAFDVSYSAKQKARKEIAEVARDYIEQSPDHLHEEVAKYLENDLASAQDDHRKQVEALDEAASVVSERHKRLEDWGQACTS
jgi:hypothetical protein